MIRKFKTEELEQVMQLWLSANLQAHDFIAADYWHKNYAAVKEALPQAELYVYCENEQVLGFVGLQDNYLAGIFVAPAYQGKGIGKKLLAQAKKVRQTLKLHVYQKNVLARKFYARQGFTEISWQEDESTGETEFQLRWNK